MEADDGSSYYSVSNADPKLVKRYWLNAKRVKTQSLWGKQSKRFTVLKLSEINCFTVQINQLISTNVYQQHMCLWR